MQTPNLKTLIRHIRQEKRNGKRIVFTNGCFDLIHAGHVRLLKQAKTYGDILVVAVNSDKSVQHLKGKNRPILPLRDRLTILRNLKPVDFVISFSQATPESLIRKLHPDVLIKGGDWTQSQVAGGDHVLAHKGKVVSGLFIKGQSTTQIIRKIKKLP